MGKIYKLPALTDIAGVLIKASAHGTPNVCKGVFKCADLKLCTKEEIIAELCPQGVVTWDGLQTRWFLRSTLLQLYHTWTLDTFVLRLTLTFQTLEVLKLPNVWSWQEVMQSCNSLLSLWWQTRRGWMRQLCKMYQLFWTTRGLIQGMPCVAPGKGNSEGESRVKPLFPTSKADCCSAENAASQRLYLCICICHWPATDDPIVTAPTTKHTVSVQVEIPQLLVRNRKATYRHAQMPVIT